MYLRQSTASQKILLGSFLDDTDGKTAETGLTIANTDIKLWKGGATTEASKNSGGATHIAGGRYYAVLDATDTNTVGMLEVNVHVAGALPVRRQFYVLEEAVYDALFAASAAGYQVPIWATASSTVNLSGTTVKTATDVDTVVNSVTFGLSALKTLIDTLTAYVDTEVAAIKAKTDNLPNDPADASDIAASFSTVNTTLATIASYIDTEVTAIKSKTDNLPANPAAAGDIPSASVVADAVWDEVLSGHSTSGTTGAKLLSLSAGGDATLSKQTEILSAIAGLSAASGSGAYTLTVQVTDGTTALQGAKVRLTQGVTTLSATTNASGIATFGVDALTYAVAITKDGYSFAPTTKAVSGTGTQTYAMTAVVITPPSSPALSTVTAQILTAAGAAVPKARVRVRITASPGGSGSICLGDYATYTADEDGVVEMELIKNATYQLQVVGYRGWNEFTPDTDTFEVPDIIAGT